MANFVQSLLILSSPTVSFTPIAYLLHDLGQINLCEAQFSLMQYGENHSLQKNTRRLFCLAMKNKTDTRLDLTSTTPKTK